MTPFPQRQSSGLLAAIAILLSAACLPALAGPAAPTPADWAALGTWPDWSGVWTPAVGDQMRRIKTDPVPWTPAAAAQIAAMIAEEKAGNPRGLFIDCLPEGRPSWMLITHNALEFLFSPGRVTMLGLRAHHRLHDDRPGVARNYTPTLRVIRVNTPSIVHCRKTLM